jgi:hypothetical protein
VTGSTSHKTAVITRLFTGYIVVKDLSGTFTAGEPLVTATWSATLGTQTDYANQQNAPEYYWTDNQTSVRCRFYRGDRGGNAVLSQTGDMSLKPLMVSLPPTVTIADTDYRVSTTTTGFAGTYDLTVFPKEGIAVIDHYECVLTRVQTP